MSQLVTISLAPGQATMQQTAGKYLSIKNCGLPIVASFNGGQNETVFAGQVFDKSGMNGGQGFNYFSLTNTNAVAVTVSFFAGGSPVSYNPADNSQSNAATFAFGNLGVAINGAAGSAFAGSPQCDGYGYLQITNAMQLVIPNIGNVGPTIGHRRQVLTFTMAPAGTLLSSGQTQQYSLNICDANGLAFMTIAPGAIVSLPYDATFIVSGVNGTVGVTIGQIFLASN
jgi:hypothetical protein